MSLEKLFTGSATAKILDVLWEYQDIDLTLTDIADEAGVHYTTLMKALPLLEELGMVTMMRQVGNAKLYQINRDDAVVKKWLLPDNPYIELRSDSMRTVAEMFAEMKKIADEEGYQFNPVQNDLDDILQGLWDNEHRYGYPSCPCRMARGVLADDMDIICPCDYRDADLVEYGCCLCTLYVNDDWISGKKKHDPIPERRPQDYYEKGYPAIMEQKGAGGKEMTEVYRCTVCGYLCARDEPPDLCPICRAKKERFEKFEMK